MCVGRGLKLGDGKRHTNGNTSIDQNERFGSAKRQDRYIPSRPLALRSFIEYSPSVVNMSAKPSWSLSWLDVAK